MPANLTRKEAAALRVRSHPRHQTPRRTARCRLKRRSANLQLAHLSWIPQPGKMNELRAPPLQPLCLAAHPCVGAAAAAAVVDAAAVEARPIQLQAVGLCNLRTPHRAESTTRRRRRSRRLQPPYLKRLLHPPLPPQQRQALLSYRVRFLLMHQPLARLHQLRTGRQMPLPPSEYEVPLKSHLWIVAYGPYYAVAFVRYLGSLLHSCGCLHSRSSFLIQPSVSTEEGTHVSKNSRFYGRNDRSQGPRRQYVEFFFCFVIHPIS